MLTDEQLKQFGKHKAGYSTGKKVIRTNGDLYLDGIKHLNNLPFPILQKERKKLLMQGYISKRIKIKYHG